MKKLFSTAEVCRQAMVAPHRLVYAMSQNKIPEPRNRLNGRRAFTLRDVARIKAYFNQKESGTTLPK